MIYTTTVVNERDKGMFIDDGIFVIAIIVSGGEDVEIYSSEYVSTMLRALKYHDILEDVMANTVMHLYLTDREVLEAQEMMK